VKVERALYASNGNLSILNSITRHDVSNQLTIIDGYLGLLTGLGLFLSKAILAITNISISELPIDGGVRFDLQVPKEMFRTRTPAGPEP
jgi:hypothetical protein